MTSQLIGTMVEIAGKSYQLKCSAQEVDSIKRAATYLETKMQEVRQQAQALTADRIAVVAALNIAHEFLNVEHSKSQEITMINERLRSLQSKVEDFFAQTAQMELQASE